MSIEFIVLTNIRSNRFMKRVDLIRRVSEIELGKCRVWFTDGESFDVEETIEQILAKMKELQSEVKDG